MGNEPRRAIDVAHLRNSPITGLRRVTNHPLHIAVSIVTLGLWLPVYLAIALVNRPRKQ